MATFPANNKVPGNAGLTTDLDTTYGLLQNILGGVVLPSGDTTGATDGPAIATALTSYGRCQLVAGTYYVTANTVVLDAKLNQFLEGAVDGGTLINLVGVTAGPAVTIKNTAGAYSAFLRSGLRNLRVDGTSAAAGSAGVQAGDSARMVMENISASNFTGTGAYCFHFLNSVFWTEQLTGTIFAYNGTTCVAFDVTGTGTNSFERPDLTCYIGMLAGQDGVALLGATTGANIVSGRLNILGNCSGTATSAQAVLALRGASSTLTSVNLNIGVENDSNTGAPSTILYGGSTQSVVRCYGTMNFLVPAGQTAFAGATITANNFLYTGAIAGDAANLQSVTLPGNRPIASIASNATIVQQYSSVTRVAPTAAVTGIILGAGGGASDGKPFTIINAAASGSGFSITFAASATSHVADGTADVIAAGTAATYVWDNTSALWYRM